MSAGDKYKVWVELDENSKLPVRIIKSRFDVFSLPVNKTSFVSKKYATEIIRDQVFARDNFECQRCGARLNLQTGHTDHKISRSEGGDTSVDNCWLLCAECHVISETSEHGDRVPKFSRTKR